MPVDVCWDNEEKTVVRADVRGIWTIEEMSAARREAFKLLDTVPHRVDILWHWADQESLAHMPSGGLMNLLASMQRTPHPRRGIIVFAPKRQEHIVRLWNDVVIKAFPRLRKAVIHSNS